MPKPAPVFWIGVFFGVLLGSFLVLLLGTSDTSETFDDYERRMAQQGGGRPAPPEQPPQGHGAAPGGDRAQASVAKVHFMKKFVKALSELPENTHPNPLWEPLLREGAEPIRCADCHDPSKVDMERMKGLDPGAERVAPFRKNPNFMIPLMEKWVARFNERHLDRARKPLTCTDCHAVDPRRKFEVYPPLMMAFVRALREKPTNRNPASGWRPLLKDPDNRSMLCSACHGEVGKMMEDNAARLANERPEEYADNRDFMIDLMERWIDELNREGADLLVKPLTCTDCHETDPRKG